MIDIVERLRAVGGESWNNPARIRNEAADTIERLRAEVKDLNEVISLMHNDLRNYREREQTMGWNND